MKTITISDIKTGELLAYLTNQGWAYSGHHFVTVELGRLITRETFYNGAVRHNRYNPHGWAVIRGTDVIPIGPHPHP